MFDPEDFVKLAAKLLQGPCGAAEARTAAGRAYYAAFLSAQRLLEPHFRFPKLAEVHKIIYMLFVNCASADAKEIGRNLDDLRDKRNDADYHLEDGDIDDPKTAQLYVALSIQAISKIKLLLVPGSSVTLTEMKTWAALSGKVSLR